MNNLLLTNPILIKSLFIQLDRLKDGELFGFMGVSRYFLIEYFKGKLTVQLMLDIVRDLGVRHPSKFFVWNLISIVMAFKEKKHFDVLLECIAKALNTILIRIPIELIPEEFKKQLPTLAH